MNNIMSQFEAILFDMDGVLIDSEELMSKAGMMALHDFGIDFGDHRKLLSELVVSGYLLLGCQSSALRIDSLDFIAL